MVHTRERGVRERERERERDAEAFKGLILCRADGEICEKSCNTERKRIHHMMNNENINNNKWQTTK